jgi:hypothetical protein
MRDFVHLERETSQKSCPIGSGERGGNQGRDLKSRMLTLQVDPKLLKAPKVALFATGQSIVSILGTHPGCTHFGDPGGFQAPVDSTPEKGRREGHSPSWSTYTNYSIDMGSLSPTGQTGLLVSS